MIIGPVKIIRRIPPIDPQGSERWLERGDIDDAQTAIYHFLLKIKSMREGQKCRHEEFF